MLSKLLFQAQGGPKGFNLSMTAFPKLINLSFDHFEEKIASLQIS
tara:strand:- start:343 stop:477 length:135 start_codon:yes stop_codon:yes gene_type:complete